ncbi:MAG TPA: O-antigen ligase family protein [Alphaproteobacteria bacterium]|jgi:O-antigen ligase|nr:O-antigen ligase family protein [Alphaproteobacteria bacterium]
MNTRSAAVSGEAMTVNPESRRPILAHWLLLIFVLMPPVGVYAALGVAPLLAVAAVGVVVLSPRESWRWVRQPRLLAVLLGALAVVGMASGLWSILPQHSFLEGLRFLTLSASGLVVAGAVASLGDGARGRILRWSAISIIVTVAALALDLAVGLPVLRLFVRGEVIPLERFDRGTTVIGLLFWPITLGLWRAQARRLLAVTCVAVVVALIVIPSSANRLALAIGAVTWILAWSVPRAIPRLVLAATVVVGLALPFAIPRLLPSNESVVVLADHAPWIKFSGLHRLLIWRFVSERTAERPLLGWGMDASRELPGGHTKLVETLSRPIVPDSSEALPLHPHDAFLQWWVELGAIGAVLGLGAVVTLLLRVASLPSRVAVASATAFAVGAITIAMLGYGFWQSWWLSTLWLAGSLTAAVSTAGDQTRKS